MSFERPSKGALTFQCDACFDTFELTKADGHNVSDFAECWHLMQDEGWSMQTIPRTQTSAPKTEHYCADCSQTAKADRDNPFKR